MHLAYLFDYDDTLVKTRASKFAAIRELASRHYNYPLKDTEIEQHWGKPFDQLFSGIFSHLDRNTSQVIERYLRITSEFPMEAYPDAVPVLEKLSSRYFVGLITSASRSVLIPDLERLGFPLSNLRFIQASEDSDVHKPDPRVFSKVQIALAQEGLRAHQAVYVGDALNDFQAARGAGIEFFGVLRGNASKKQFEDIGAKCIEDLFQILILAGEIAEKPGTSSRST